VKTVAVITRTKNRELLLTRAMESVQAQVFKDYVWVVVNDGGRKEGVESIVGRAKAKGVDAMIIHNGCSKGMEAASNIGIRACKSKYIVIHDDDDSWEKNFLEKTVKFLESEDGSLFGGVVTHSMQVEEVLEGDSCRIVNKRPFNSWLKTIYVFDMARSNAFPPISFLFKREIYDTVGGYDESLPVLGDWDFNLRFLLQADIAIIPELLSNYHHRVNTPPADYCNTVIHGVDKHALYDMVIRNRNIRNCIKDGSYSLGQLVNDARIAREITGSVNTLSQTISEVKRIVAGTIIGRVILRAFGIGYRA